MSKSSNNASANASFGLPTLLLVLFIYLKLTHQIDWSWWWVLAPFWIPAFIALVLLGIILFIRSRAIKTRAR